MSKESIKIVGACEHNLKNLTLSIPRDNWSSSPVSAAAANRPTPWT